ncbi:MAG TPA: DUF2244 domain-containing protein [Rubrivivax sp.]|nr:DUF2244 domain-containing protein [Rubrivivax sp.]
MRRNCALTPRQTLASFGALCALMLPTGMAWGLLGYTLVTVFVLVELLIVAVLLCCYARHACDAETLLLKGGRLEVRQCVAGQQRVTELEVAALRVTLAAEPPQLVALGARGAGVLVGCHLPAAYRRQLADELRRAVRAQGCLV